jgi:hypothetical protein
LTPLIAIQYRELAVERARTSVPEFKSLPKHVEANSSVVAVALAKSAPPETNARDLKVSPAGILTGASTTVVVVVVKGADTHRRDAPKQLHIPLPIVPAPEPVLRMLPARQLEQPSIAGIPAPPAEDAPTGLLPELALKAPADNPAPVAAAAVAHRAPQNDQRAVLAALQNYSAAWNSKDAAAIRAVRPGLRQHTLRKELADVDSIDMQIRPASNPQIDGDRAAVECVHDVHETFTGGVERSASGVRTTYTLVRQHGAWVIEDIIPH